jgi:adenylate/guanylate cyclase family protein
MSFATTRNAPGRAVGDGDLVFQVRPLAAMARILVGADVVPRPAIECALAHAFGDWSMDKPETRRLIRPQPAEPRHQDTAERRQVTVLFSDLVGSTALSARMDPEDLREVISAYQKCVAETVQRFGGFVAKYMGDGVLIYFGIRKRTRTMPRERCGLDWN